MYNNNNGMYMYDKGMYMYNNNKGMYMYMQMTLKPYVVHVVVVNIIRLH